MRILLLCFLFLAFSPLSQARLVAGPTDIFFLQSSLFPYTQVAQYNRRSSQEFYEDDEISYEDEQMLDGGGQSESFDNVNSPQSFEPEGEFDHQDSFREEEPRAKRRSSRRSRARRSSRSSSYRGAISQIRSGNAERASEDLYNASRRGDSRAKYLTGLALMELGFYQAATFQFVSLIKKGDRNYSKRSLEKLSIAAGYLGDNTLIDYAISRMGKSAFSSKQKSLLAFRQGEFQLRQGSYREAIKSFNRVKRRSPYYAKSLYMKGLSFARAGRPRLAVRVFNKLIRLREDEGKKDTFAVTALLAKARALYQAKQWDASVEAYREIPRDSIYWHDALFEQTWAFLMSAQFRSALSTFQSLHSPYYEKHFIPESLVLRSIVYLYICNYKEMEKVSRLFEKVYVPILNRLQAYTSDNRGEQEVFDDFNEFLNYWLEKEKSEKTYKGEIPYIVGRYLLKDGEIKRLFQYLMTLKSERRKWDSMSGDWKSSGVGEYTLRAIEKRLSKVSRKIGRKVQEKLIATSDQLQEFVEQNGFLRFEMLSAKKDKIKKRISGQSVKKRKTVNEKEERDFYVQNGYDYWPFEGEYWLDELGNYYFLGVQSCE